MSLAWESRNATESGFTYAIITASEDSSTLTQTIASNLLKNANSYNDDMSIRDFIEGEQVYDIQFGLKLVGFTEIAGDALVVDDSYAVSNMGKIKLDAASEPTLTTIGEGILINVPVTTIEIPSSVTLINPLAFSGSSIDNIIVDSDNTTYSTGNVIANEEVSGVLYNKAGTELLIYPTGKAMRTITIPEGVTTIGENAFHYNTTIASVTLASTITTIKNGAFVGTTSLVNLLPNLKSTMTIGEYAFVGSAITEIVAVALTIDDRSQETTNGTTITYNPISPADPTTEKKIYDITSTVEKDEKTVTWIWKETVNSKPVITSSATFSAPEKQTAIGSVTATDADGNTPLTYSVSGDELEISSSGVLTFKNAPVYETKSSYTATVTVSDETNNVTQDITVNVHDGTFTSDYSAESENNISTIITVTFTGTGTLGVDFVNKSLATFSIEDRTLKVLVVGYNDISDTFSMMDKKNHLNIVDLSGMVENTELDEEQTQGLDGFAFYECTNLREITLFSNCTDIETNAFGDCTNLKKIYKIPSGISAETTGVNTIFGGKTKDNMVTIFDIAVGITGRDVENNAVEINYDPENPKTATNEEQTYDVTATATLKSDDTYEASKIFSETVSAVSNSAPTFTSIPVTSADEDVAYTYPVATNDVDVDDTVTVTATTKPDWLSFDGTTLSGTPPNSDVGDHNVVLSATDGSATVTQSFTITVTNVNDPPSGSLTITGTLRQGEELTAVTTGISDDDGLGDFSYQWKRGGVDINDATSSTYTLVQADVGKKIKVTVTYKDDQGTTETLISDETTTVTNENDSPRGDVTISGEAKQGDKLTADTSTIIDADGLGDFTYQWKRDGTDISGATSSTYTLVQADVGNKISVTVTYTDNQETVESLTSTETSAVLNKEPFKPKTKTELQTAIDIWYEFANGSAGTTRTSETSNETDKNSKFYLSNEPNDEGISLDIKGKLDSDEYLNAEKGITKENLVKVEIGTDVKSIDQVTFYRCAALTTVTIPDSVTSIGAVAFAGCKNLKTVIIPDSVTSIGGQAFQMCDALTSVIIPDSVTIIDGQTFQHCTALKTVTIGTSVTSIGGQAFYDCDELTTLTIPDSVTTIGSDAFVHSGLKTLYMSENNGLKLEEGEQSVGGETVNVVFIPSNPNNYDGPEYYGNPNTWDTSLITDISFLFFKKDQENHPDISTWDVSKVTNMQGTFSNSTFNGELKDWNVASVKDFSYCFANNVVFNQELKRWNVQDATTMESMFDNAYSFNQKIEPPMMQNKDGTDFPTQLTWNEEKVNGYLETIYGSAAPQTNPTTFKGVFGMIALLKKSYLDNIPDDPTEVGKYNTIKASFSEVMSELITNQQEILKYNYTYDEDEETWTKTDPSIYFANTNGSKTDNDLNDAKDSLNQLRLNTIVDGMLLINKAYDIAKDLGETDYSGIIEKMKSIYDNVYAGLPFYVAWYAPLLTTKENFLNNALTFHNGATGGTINPKLTSFIKTKPIRSINDIDYNNTQKQEIVESSSDDLYENFKTAYNS